MQNVTIAEQPIYAGNDQTNLGQNVNTGQVQETVHIFMGAILIMIIIFLAVHLFIRFHYKAKTDYALNELREKFEKNMKGPSPYALPKDTKNLQEGPSKPAELILEPEQLAPIVHHMALAPVEKVEEASKHVYYKSNP